MLPVQTAFVEIFSEAFEAIKPGATGTWFVEKNEGFFQAIDGLSAERASRVIAPDVSTVAAHTDHTRYYIALTNAFLRGETPTADWDASWQNQTVDEVKWKEIRDQLKEEVGQLMAFAKDHTPETTEELIGAFANVAHAAFHLGAVRQLLKILASQ